MNKTHIVLLSLSDTDFLQAGKNLWNNMVEPVDSRTSIYDVNKLSIKCPTEGDFIATTQ